MSKEPRPPQQQTSVANDVHGRHRRRWLHVILSGMGTLFMSWVIVFCIPNIIDITRAYNFHAPENVISISTRLKLSSRGEDIFYASTPAIESKAEFNKDCQAQERTSAVLGCFTQDKIYLYDIKDTELDGTLEVTAAHEMLHAAYQRLTIFERWYIDKMIVAQYEKVKNDETIKTMMTYYSKAEPGAEVNELHSILGTIVRTLDPALESYYTRYFKERGMVVTLNEKYNKVFSELDEKSTALDAKIKAEEPEIEQALASYDADRVLLEKSIASFNARASAGNFTSQTTYAAERNTLLVKVEALNARRDEINTRVATYNADIAEYNRLSTRTTELYQDMNGVESTEMKY